MWEFWPISNPESAVAKVPRTGAVIAFCIGVLAFAGWILNVAWLRAMPPGSATLKPDTAVALCLGALSLWLAGSGRSRTRLLANVFGLFLAIIGTATVFEYFWGADLGIDSL